MNTKQYNITLIHISSIADYYGTDTNGIVMVFEHQYSPAYYNTKYRVFMNYGDKTVTIQLIDEFADIIDLYYLTDIETDYMYDLTMKYIQMYESANRMK